MSMDNLDVPEGDDDEESVDRGVDLNDSSDRELAEKSFRNTAKKTKEGEDPI